MAGGFFRWVVLLAAVMLPLTLNSFGIVKWLVIGSGDWSLCSEMHLLVCTDSMASAGSMGFQEHPWEPGGALWDPGVSTNKRIKESLLKGV